jgi:hypothetical protein
MKLLLSLSLVVLLCAALGIAQVTTTAPLDGTVTDPAGAVVVGAEVTVTNSGNGQTFKATSDERGHWILPAMGSGTYRVSVVLKGFRTAVVEGVKIDSGVPASVNAKLEIGQVTETVEITAGAELVQATNATLNTTLQGRQIFELPFSTRSALDLLVTQPGTQTGDTARNTFVNGLPASAINITIDGINTQDNYYKSGDGFFTLIPPRSDSMEEVTLTTAAAGADSLAGGAAQVKFITKSGTNAFHGGAFWQHRNTALNANYYFNNINGLARDRVILNQGGVRLGGPIYKNKLFFFNNYEVYRYPAQTSATRTVLAPGALNGDFQYVAGGTLRKVNVLDVAGAAGYTSSQDPIIQSTLAKINGLTANGTIRSRVPTSNDYNRNDLLFQPKGMTKNDYNTTKLDYNLNSSNQLAVTYTYYKNDSTPDITNSIVPIFPGTGTVLGQDDLVAGQRGNRYAGVVSLRSSITPMITNEFRAGMNRSISMFRDQVSSPALFSAWRGYSPTLGYVTSVASVSGSSRRTSPVKEIHDTVSWVKGKHLLSFGVDFSQINFWYQSVGTSVIPTISFSGINSGDPIDTGSTGIFTTANFPSATSTDLSNAKALYAMLTGRVVSISRSVVLDENTHQYGSVPQVERNRQREWGLFFQDSIRLTSSLTASVGLRFEQQRPFENLNQLYSSVSNESAWGLSGVDNMYKPGTLTGKVPVFDKAMSPYNPPNTWSPSASLAYQVPGLSGPLGALLGTTKGKSVFRAGYAIASVREGSYIFQNIYGSNKGISQSASVNPIDYPQNFGAAGSVLFRNATLPTRPTDTAPNYPLSASFADSLNAFDPNLKMGYVQSWNLGWQRELSQDTVMEVRYTGNSGANLWRQVNLNEVNVFESGFLKEFDIARNNLAIAQAASASSVNFGNQGLAGQQNIPMISTALGTTSDTTFATYIRQNRAGTVASNIATNATRAGRLAAGYPANLFVVNPTVAGGGTYEITNLGSSNYNALQLELRRRLSHGVILQGSYVWAHSIANGANQSLNAYSTPTTFRNIDLDRANPSSDIRQAYKYNAIYELPIGPGKRFLSGSNSVLKRIAEGWQISGIGRIQSGTPFQLTSGRGGMTSAEAGVVLYNMTAADLQKMVEVRKTTASNGQGLVYYLPDSLIANTNAAFELNGKTRASLDTNAPYIGPQWANDSFGYKVYLRNPWQYRLDLGLLKKTTIRETANAEFRVQFLNALNKTNFFINGNMPSSASFGQTTTAFRDFSGSADPGSRVIEFVLRVSF